MTSVIKKRLAAAVCTATLAVGTFSCQTDLINPNPKTYLLAEQAFDTPTRVLAQVNGLYSYVKVGNFLGGRYQIYGDIRANDFLNRTSNSVTGLTVWNHTEAETSQNDVVNTWSAWAFHLEDLQVPVDLWYGRMDTSPVHSPDFGQTMSIRIPHSRLFIRETEGSALLWTRGEEILRELLAH
ncbi:MAG: hypothetical protein EOP69_01285 [Spirochaetia bacterium]|nr:MAG: hypothetical protein EOP69_01285 [Spirochaetia bacterium]